MMDDDDDGWLHVMRREEGKTEIGKPATEHTRTCLV